MWYRIPACSPAASSAAAARRSSSASSSSCRYRCRRCSALKRYERKRPLRRGNEMAGLLSSSVEVLHTRPADPESVFTSLRSHEALCGAGVHPLTAVQLRWGKNNSLMFNQRGLDDRMKPAVTEEWTLESEEAATGRTEGSNKTQDYSY
ncbi:Hypothetical predicted protein [Xyrichtys novacula]|uniref:Uncharacterized protein n=1 Tax=Xyrichtys novacula TaxID=13765 RepID=A0AAV1FX27_XYRNO|nr:Hypothetical predicted protein [Xyrichtys novacula]